MKVSDWFPPEVKPTIPGVYEIQNLRYPFYWWTGKEWLGACSTPEEWDEEPGEGCRETEFVEAFCWRGLAEKP